MILALLLNGSLAVQTVDRQAINRALGPGEFSDCPGFRVLPSGDVICAPPLDLSRVDSAPPEPVPVEQIADAVVLDGVALGLGLALDLWSTELAEREGYVEANPLGWNGNARLALKIGSTAVVVGTLYVFRRHGHRTLANVLRWICLGLQGAASAINFHNASHGR